MRLSAGPHGPLRLQLARFVRLVERLELPLLRGALARLALASDAVRLVERRRGVRVPDLVVEAAAGGEGLGQGGRAMRGSGGDPSERDTISINSVGRRAANTGGDARLKRRGSVFVDPALGLALGLDLRERLVRRLGGREAGARGVSVEVASSNPSIRFRTANDGRARDAAKRPNSVDAGKRARGVDASAAPSRSPAISSTRGLRKENSRQRTHHGCRVRPRAGTSARRIRPTL